MKRRTVLLALALTIGGLSACGTTPAASPLPAGSPEAALRAAVRVVETTPHNFTVKGRAGISIDLIGEPPGAVPAPASSMGFVMLRRINSQRGWPYSAVPVSGSVATVQS